MIIFMRMNDMYGRGPKLGGRGKVVIIDETYFTKKKVSRGGFQGRYTRGHKTIIMGMVELDLATRQETGNMRLITLPGTTKAIFKDAIEAHILRGSLILTDSHRSYSFLSRRLSGYVHRCVNHRQREFSKM